VRWADGAGETGAYIGRTSNIVEYVGPARLNVAVRFVPPSSIGFDEALLAARGEVAICGRGISRDMRVEAGWLVHHIRPVPGMAGAIGKFIGRAAARFQKFTATQATELFIHDAQEMNHLAAILPDLFAAFGPEVSR